jgi:hypothetical protein
MQGMLSSILRPALGIASAGLLIAALHAGHSATSLGLTVQTAVWGGSCQAGYGYILAGSCLLIAVTDYSDVVPEEPTAEWPEGFELLAMADFVPGEPFVSTAGLMNQVSPSRYVSLTNMAESTRLADIPTHVNVRDLNSKWFTLRIPHALVGRTMAIQARRDGEGTGLRTSNVEVVRIVAPCSRGDTARIVSSYVLAALDAHNFLRATELVDSMLAVGLSDPFALYYGRSCAESMQDYGRALTYLDRLYSEFGIVRVQANESRPEWLTVQYREDQEMREIYLDKRWRLVELQHELQSEDPDSSDETDDQTR